MISKFKQLPVSIKLVVIWFLLLGLSSFWRTGNVYIETKSTFELGTLIRGIIECSLAIGLINKSNESRTWAAFYVLLGSLGVLFLLAIMVFEDPDPTKGFYIQTSVSQEQSIIYLLVFLVLNIGTLFALLKPTTKAFFASQTTQLDNK